MTLSPTAAPATPIQLDRKPRMELMDITPDQAARWLRDVNTRNRNMSRSNVDRMARDILAGRFLLTHQGIAFSTEGVLLDGQNRLAAVVKADRPVAMYVCFDMPPETQLVADQQTPRLSCDALTLSERYGRVTKREMGTLRTMMTGLGTCVKMTVAEQGDLLMEHREAIGFAIQHAHGKVRGVFTAALHAVVARAWYTADRDCLARFCEVLREPAAVRTGESAATTLWVYLVKSLVERGRTSQRDRYARIERTLDGFLRGETLARVRATKSELFPLPAEAAQLPEPVPAEQEPEPSDDQNQEPAPTAG